jgi:hypothetical protein
VTHSSGPYREIPGHKPVDNSLAQRAHSVAAIMRTCRNWFQD